MTKMLL